MYGLYSSDAVDKNLEYCSHFIIKELFRILDSARTKGETDERKFLLDFLFALLNIFKNKGNEPSVIEKKSSLTKDELHRILSDRESIHNLGGIGDSNQTDVFKIKRFQYFCLFFSFLWWNLEWKLFWRLWKDKGNRNIEFKMIDRFIDFTLYKDSIQISGDIISDSFNDSIVNDIRWIHKIYGVLESLLLVHLKLSLGTKNIDSVISKQNIDRSILVNGVFDLCFPLNINILEIGVLNQRELVKGSIDEISKTSKMMDLGISSFYYWVLRGQWLSEFKYHLIKVNNKKTKKYTQKKVDEFSEFCNEFAFNFLKNMKNSLPEVKQINSLLIAPIHCDLNLIIKSERIYSYDKILLKALLKGVVLTYKTQAVYFGESKLINHLLEYAMSWGMNSWIFIREKVLGISAERTHIQEKSIIEKFDGIIN